MEESAHFPKLRFRSFSEPWIEVALKEAFSNFRKKGDASLPIYSVSQSLGMVPREALERTIQQDAKPEQNLRVEAGDIAYNMMRMWQGAFGVSKTACMISPAYVVLKPKRQISSLFFKHQFGRSRSLYLFGAYSHGLTKDRLRLYFDDFGSIKAVVPSFKEQQKIATFLSSVDERIELLEQKKGKLEVYKKGVMQRIFPSAGSERAPQIRFRQDDGAEFPDWEERKLGEVCEIKKGQQLNKSELTGEGTYPAINGGIEPSGYTDDWNTQENTITISEGGNSCGYVNFIKTKFWSGGHCYTIQKITSKIWLLFLFQLLKFNEKKIMKLRVGSGLPNIQKSDFQKLQLSIPSLPEQKKISAFLDSLDKNLETLDSQIQALRTWKKGLLQQMFV